MGLVCAVSFSRYGKLYYLDPGEHRPRVGDLVLVPTDSDPELAECVWAPQWSEDHIGGLPVLVGLAGPEDIARDERSAQRRADARLAMKRLVRVHDLPMKLLGVDFVSSLNHVTIYFSSPGRVDFRALVRDLSGTLSARVELRQLRARDEARVLGGIGSCGRDLCCATFLKDFEPVSVRMAKTQDLPANPLRISGACGRLLCCLKYEHPLYQDFQAGAPAVGSAVETPEGPGVVTGYDVPRQQVVTRLSASGARCACSKASVCGPRQAYEGSASAAVPVGGDAS